jgi:hypothetical protein
VLSVLSVLGVLSVLELSDDALTELGVLDENDELIVLSVDVL